MNQEPPGLANREVRYERQCGEEAKQRAENYRKALDFLQGLQSFTYEDYTKSLRMAGIEMTETEMRQQWNMAKMTIPGTESLRQTQVEVLREGAQVSEEAAEKLGG